MALVTPPKNLRSNSFWPMWMREIGGWCPRNPSLPGTARAGQLDPGGLEGRHGRGGTPAETRNRPINNFLVTWVRSRAGVYSKVVLIGSREREAYAVSGM